jgi:hypothetical protein
MLIGTFSNAALAARFPQQERERVGMQRERERERELTCPATIWREIRVTEKATTPWLRDRTLVLKI